MLGLGLMINKTKTLVSLIAVWILNDDAEPVAGYIYKWDDAATWDDTKVWKD